MQQCPLDRLVALDRWYASQCDGQWEHQYGISLGTVDNPGWHLKVDLAETYLADRPFDQVFEDQGGDWIRYFVRDQVFIGACSPSRLAELIDAFLLWAGSDPSAV